MCQQPPYSSWFSALHPLSLVAGVHERCQPAVSGAGASRGLPWHHQQAWSQHIQLPGEQYSVSGVACDLFRYILVSKLNSLLSFLSLFFSLKGSKFVNWMECVVLVGGCGIWTEFELSSSSSSSMFIILNSSWIKARRFEAKLSLW